MLFTKPSATCHPLETCLDSSSSTNILWQANSVGYFLNRPSSPANAGRIPVTICVSIRQGHDITKSHLRLSPAELFWMICELFLSILAHALEGRPDLQISFSILTEIAVGLVQPGCRLVVKAGSIVICKSQQFATAHIVNRGLRAPLVACEQSMRTPASSLDGMTGALVFNA